MRVLFRAGLVSAVALLMATVSVHSSSADERSGRQGIVAMQPTTTEQPSTTQPSATTVAPSSGQGAEPSQGSTRISGWVLLFGAGTLAFLYIYLYTWQQRTGVLTLAVLRRTGNLPTYEHIPVYVRPPFEAAGEEQPPKKLAITGPATAVLGRPSEPFQVTLDGQTVSATWETDWSRATLDPLEGPATRVTAVKEGPLQVRASVAESPLPAVAHVAVVAAARTPGSVPFVGGGYGGLTVAILAVTIAGALTAQGILPSAALATLLGTVVSYFFVQRREGQDDSGQPGGGAQASADAAGQAGQPGQGADRPG